MKGFQGKGDIWRRVRQTEEDDLDELCFIGTDRRTSTENVLM